MFQLKKCKNVAKTSKKISKGQSHLALGGIAGLRTCYLGEGEVVCGR